MVAKKRAPPGKAPVLPREAAVAAPPSGAPRALVVHPSTAVRRMVREALEGLTEAVVDSAPTSARGFEMALQRDYKLFLFGLDLPEIEGELLYQLIETAYRYTGVRDGGGSRFAPAVVYVMDAPNADKREELRRDARVRGVMVLPIRIDTLLDVTANDFKRKGVGVS